MRTGWALAGIVALVVAGCSSGTTSHAASSSTSGPTTTIATTTTAAPSTSTATANSSTATAENRPVTPAVRQSLLEAGAAHQQLPSSDYTGLVPGETYYAFDPASDTYWAGAALQPSPSSQQALVSSQDDGSYFLFRMPATGGPWTVYDDGLGGVGGAPCPATIPPGVVAAWGWAPGTCRRPNG